MNEPAKTYSTPDQPVRHHYPLAIESEGFSAALGIFLKTWPFIAARFAVLVAFTVATIIWIALCGGISALFSGKDGGGGFVLFLLSVGVPVGFFAWLRHYMLYLLKLGHVAVITELIVHGKVPEDISQVGYGKKIVTDRFAQTNILFVVDSLVTGVAKSFNSTLEWVTGLVPIPGIQNVVRLVQKIVDNATTFIDETIFSYNLARGDENVWRSSMDGLVYYAQNSKPVLKTAVFALVIEYVITGVAFLICLAPAWAVGRILPGAVASFAWILAVIIAGAIRTVALHPLFLTMVALTFHVNCKNKEISLSMAQTLRDASDKFEELSTKAREWAKGETKVVRTTEPVA